mgnify:CR=1 FL=1
MWVNMELLSDDNLTTVNIGGVDYADMICTNIWQGRRSYKIYHFGK